MAVAAVVVGNNENENEFLIEIKHLSTAERVSQYADGGGFVFLLFSDFN